MALGAPIGNQYAKGCTTNGRPTEYRPELLKKAQGFLSWCEANPIEIEPERELKDGKIKPAKTRKRLPTIARFARYLDVSRETVYKWSRDKEKADFIDVFRSIQSESEAMLQEEGLVGNYNPLMAKFLLSADHGKRERADITSQDEKIESNLTILNDEQLDRLIEARTRRVGVTPRREREED